ncbi:CtsR family transcriptional regulator [Desulfolucanica intricata]|uniref:CtsR family transcriptional regulator n=1 Tax=Desulfolucanica intricata TaxID=1285191 RepID=UPI00082FC5D8|nr:CtsR family transcriptional regulator [Desulfolucanica intricata]
MSNLSNLIEKHLKKLLEESSIGYIDIKRNELAEYFNCVPSQINYVLSTRFTYENGYLVESRRGGAGYVRIIRLSLKEQDRIIAVITKIVGNSISQAAAERVINRLFEENIINMREANIMKAAIHRNVLKIDLPWRDSIRALILKAMLVALLKEY